MRKKCLRMVYEMAETDERIFFIGSDLGFETLKEFREGIPDRFIMEGISEANVIGMAAGLALEGKIPFVNTIATFITRRAFEQIAVDVCMHNVSVRMIGNGGGLVYAPLGSTHLAIEDISIMRALPNMTIVCPCDEDEMARFMPLTLEYSGPIYIRLGKGYDPIVSKEKCGFAIGKGIHYRKGNDALIVTTGITLQEAIGAADLLEQKDISTCILHLHTVKPLDTELFLDLAANVRVVVVAEENSIIGGLGSALAEILAEADVNPSKKFKRVGIPDIFPDYYGTQKKIMERFGLNPDGLAKIVLELMPR